MINIKTLLRLMGAITLSSFAANSVVACGNETAPNLNGKYAALLGWYDSDNKTSKITQRLNYDSTTGKEKYSIIVDDSLIKTVNLFKNKLLNANKAKNSDAATFLKELGFTSGSESKDYSGTDVTSITNLVAKVQSSNPGAISAKSNNSDFKVTAGTCQINIMSKEGTDGKLLKSYTIKTIKNDTLGIPATVASIVTKTNLDLIKDKGYKQNGPVLTSLPWKSDKSEKQKQFDSLIKLFDQESLIWTSDAAGQTIIDTYPTTGNAYLTIKFGSVKVLNALDCGAIPA